MEPHTAVEMTPEEERELKFPVKEEQSPSSNFTPVQLIILFIQFCLVGVFMGAIISNDSDQKDVASSQKIIYVTVEREKKAGGGFKYRLVAGKRGRIEAIILENLPSYEQSATDDINKVMDQETAIQWMSTSDPPLKSNKQKQKVSVPPQVSITKDASMPSPPVPPPWSSLASPGPLLSGGNKKPTTRTSFKFSSSRSDFYRG